MRCPTCDVDLIDNDRLGLKTGYCPECEGEWFGRGGVDRLLDRAAGRQRLRAAATAAADTADTARAACAGPLRGRQVGT